MGNEKKRPHVVTRLQHSAIESGNGRGVTCLKRHPLLSTDVLEQSTAASAAASTPAAAAEAATTAAEAPAASFKAASASAEVSAIVISAVDVSVTSPVDIAAVITTVDVSVVSSVDIAAVITAVDVPGVTAIQVSAGATIQIPAVVAVDTLSSIDGPGAILHAGSAHGSSIDRARPARSADVAALIREVAATGGADVAPLAREIAARAVDLLSCARRAVAQ